MMLARFLGHIFRDGGSLSSLSRRGEVSRPCWIFERGFRGY
jgi:hypothetical protein